LYPCVAVDGGEGCDQGGEENRVGCECGRGLLALLGDTVGDELEGGDFVVVSCENVEREWRDVVEGG
jgi:hypothetical protein